MALSAQITGPDVGLILKGHARALDVISAKAVLKAATFAGGQLAKTVMRVFSRGSGQLARSFLPARFIARARGVSAGALSDLPHAGIQDRGGTIKPKTAKMLAIPLSRKAKARWPRDWPNDALTLIKTKAGKLLLIGAKSKTLVVHYVLKERTKIRGKGYIAKAEKAVRPKVQKLAEREAQKHLAAVAKKLSK